MEKYTVCSSMYNWPKSTLQINIKTKCVSEKVVNKLQQDHKFKIIT